MRYNLIGVTVLKKPEFHCCDLCGTKHRNVYTVEKVLDEGEDDQEAFPKSIGSECYSKRIESLLPADFDDAGRTRSVNKELSLAEKYARLATEELLFVFQQYCPEGTPWAKQNLARFTCQNNWASAKILKEVQEDLKTLYAWPEGKVYCVQVRKEDASQTFTPDTQYRLRFNVKITSPAEGKKAELQIKSARPA